MTRMKYVQPQRLSPGEHLEVEIAAGPEGDCKLRLACEADPDGRVFVQLSGIGCDLEGEMPGLYYPQGHTLPSEPTPLSHLGEGAEWIGAGDEVAILSDAAPGGIIATGIIVDIEGEEALVRAESESDPGNGWMQKYPLARLAHIDSPQAEAAASFGEQDPACPACGSTDLGMWAEDGESPEADYWHCEDCGKGGDVNHGEGPLLIEKP